MSTNQQSKPILETTLFKSWSQIATDAELNQAIILILEHLNCTIVRTNATKHGNTELELRKDES